MAQPQTQTHALVFRIMRLARPSLASADTLRFRLDRDFGPDAAAAAAQPQLASAMPASPYPFSGRVALEGEGEGPGLSGLMCLPQSFGLVYLGEAFQAYVTVCNFSEEPVTNVAVKVELQTEGSKAVLYDNTPSPVPVLAPGQRHDFLIKHDIKELGSHTLACSSLYTAPDSERKYLPQHFRFSSANPMVVRTRHRLVGDSVFLEATLENVTKGPIVMELVNFQPLPPWGCTQVGSYSGSSSSSVEVSQEAGPLGEYLRSAPIVPEGGSLAFLFHLAKQPHLQGRELPPGSPAAAAAAAATPLGRLEIRWRGHMGQAARLQTQTITMAAPPPRDLSISLARLPPCVVAERPFPLELRVENGTDKRLGPLKLSYEGGGGEEGGELGAAQGLVMDGPHSVILDSVPPRQAVTVALRLVAVTPGQHALQGVVLSGERDGKQYDALARQDVYVLPACG